MSEAEGAIARINAPVIAEVRKLFDSAVFQQISLSADISPAIANKAPPLFNQELLRGLTILPANAALINQVSKAIAAWFDVPAAQFTRHSEAMAEALKLSPALQSMNKTMAQAITNISVPAIDFTKFDFLEFKLPDIDFRKLLVNFPENLDGHWGQITQLADLSIRTGIPVAWAVPSDLLTELLAAKTDYECHALLVTKQRVVLDHLSDVMSDRPGPWGTAAIQTIEAARSGQHAAAQSHAANLIDSIILHIYAQPRLAPKSGRPRQAARDHARTDIDFEQSVRALAEHITVRPVFPAFAKWYSGDPAPATFNRHATAHCVGQTDVFTESFAIIAVMLATSLARQFDTEPTPS